MLISKPYRLKGTEVIVLTFLLAFYLLNGIIYLRSQSVTADEDSFVSYAVRLLKGRPERIYPTRDNSKMPVSVINLFPRMLEQTFHPQLRKNDQGISDILAGRYVTLAMSTGILILVFVWAKKLYGPHAGLFSVFLAAFCPNLLANAGLVTTDSYSALLLLASLFLLWRFTTRQTMGRLILLALCVAGAQLVKQSLFHLYVLCPLILLIHSIANRTPVRWRKMATHVSIFLFVNWLIINLGFGFRETNMHLGNYQFSSNAFAAVQRTMPSHFVVPFPKAFFTGLDLAKYYDQVGGGIKGVSSFGNVTILGHSSTGGSFWYYYLVSLLFKTPISSLVFIVSAVCLVFRYRSRLQFVNNELFLILPVVYYIAYMSFLYKTQCGIRQIIFIYPLLYMLCGILIQFLHVRFLRTAIALLSVFLMVSVLRYWKNYYPYTNELIADKSMAYAYVGAANLEFGQGNLFFEKYLIAHPEVRRADANASTGTFLINVNDYLDVLNRHRYDWIKHIRPSGNVAYNGLLINVTEQDLGHPDKMDSHDQR